jgi:hypothetical protein
MTTILSLPYDLSFFISGGMDAPASHVGGAVATRTVSLKSGLPGSQAVCRVAPAAQVIYSLRVAGVQRGTVTFAAGQTTGVIAWAADLNMTAGQTFEVVTPASLDGAIRDVYITLVGVAQAPNTAMLP